MSRLIRCLCGNMYDPARYQTCPECGRPSNRSAAEPEPDASAPDSGGQSEPVKSKTAPKPVTGPAPTPLPSWIWKAVAGALGLLLLAFALKQFIGDDEQQVRPAGADSTTATAPIAATSGCQDIVGKWRWFTGGFVAFAADQRAFFLPTEDAPPALTADWRCDSETLTYTLSWSHGFTDTLKLYQDGQMISGRNNTGVEVSGSRYVDPAAGMPPLQVVQSGSRQIPHRLPDLLRAASVSAARWRPDAYPVGLRIRRDGYPDKDAYYVQMEFYSPSEGTGLWISSHRTRNKVMEAGTVSWSTSRLPDQFVDLPNAVDIARKNGLRGLISRAELRTDTSARPPLLLWRIVAETHGKHPPPINAITGEVIGRSRWPGRG